MNHLLETNHVCNLHPEIYTAINQIEQKIAVIISLDIIAETNLNKQKKILKEFSKIRELIAFYDSYYSEQGSKSNEQFYQGYTVGKQCNLVLYDASQIPVKQVKKALELNLNENFVSPYLVGIQLGWRLALIKQRLTRYFKI